MYPEQILTMNSLAVLIAPLALLFPATMADVPAGSREGTAAAGQDTPRLSDVGGPASATITFDPAGQAPWDALFSAHQPPALGQVRIEQQIILRISPRPPVNQSQLLSQLPQGEVATRLEERKIGSCVSASGIVGVQTGQDNRLLLFMRDRRIISAALEKACSARDFYSGFYLERNNDGRLCVKRDKLHSRAGAKCELRQIRQLVAVRN